MSEVEGERGRIPAFSFAACNASSLFNLRPSASLITEPRSAGRSLQSLRAAREPGWPSFLLAGPGALINPMVSDNSKQDSQEAPTAVPIAQVRPVVRREGTGAQISALAHYMVQTEVHTYAFSVAANVILSLFPFIVMLLTISRP